MSYLDRLMHDITHDQQAMHLINPDGKYQTHRMDQLKEALRAIEWEKKGIMKYSLKGQYRKDMSDDQILDRLQKVGRLDADDGLIFARQLEEIDPRRFEVIKKPLDVWKRLLPVKSFTPGTDRITYRVRDYTGQAELNSSANVTEHALADAYAQEASNNVYAWNLAYHYTAQELRKAAVAGIELQTDKVRSVELGYQERIQTVMLTGNTQLGLQGLFNHTNVTNSQVPAGAVTTDRTWTASTTKTPSEIVDDIADMTSDIAVATRGRYGMSGMTIAVPIEQFKYLGTKRMEAGTDTTIMQFVLQNPAFGIERFEPVYELAGIGTGSTDLALAYPMDSDVCEAQIAENILWSPMEIKGRAFIFGSEMEFGGVVVRYPVAMQQRYGI